MKELVKNLVQTIPNRSCFRFHWVSAIRHFYNITFNGSWGVKGMIDENF